MLSEDLWARIFDALQTLLFRNMECTDEDLSTARLLFPPARVVCLDPSFSNTQLLATLYLRKDMPHAAALSGFTDTAIACRHYSTAVTVQLPKLPLARCTMCHQR